MGETIQKKPEVFTKQEQQKPQAPVTGFSMSESFPAAVLSITAQTPLGNLLAKHSDGIYKNNLGDPKKLGQTISFLAFVGEFKQPPSQKNSKEIPSA